MSDLRGGGFGAGVRFVNLLFKFTQAWRNQPRLPAMSRDGFLRFQAVTRNAQDDTLGFADGAFRDQFLRAGHRDATGGLRKNAFVLREQLDPLDDFLVTRVFGSAARFMHRMDGIIAVRRRPDGE